jgi:multidrug efflux system membrane fusion protein
MVAPVRIQDFPVDISVIGAAQPWQAVTIHAQVSGVLQRVAVKEGGQVKAGQLVAEIDPAPFKAAVLQANGALIRDKALLANARVDLKRFETLARQDSIAVQQLDTQRALVQQDVGVVMLDQGALDAAQVNLDRTRILSPLNGQVGVRLVDPGNLVASTDTTGIITIDQVSPIAVAFSVPEGEFARLDRASDHFRTPLLTRAFSQETGEALEEGRLVVTDNHVDASTGTVKMKAWFANPDGRLWPGQFVDVRLQLQTIAHALVAPQTAINQGPDGPYVYLVRNGKAKLQHVSGVMNEGAMARVETGLRPGDIVVTDGQLELKPGAKVRVKSDAGRAGAGHAGAAKGRG